MTKGCLCQTLFNFKVKLNKCENENSIIDLCWYSFPWNVAVNMSEGFVGEFEVFAGGNNILLSKTESLVYHFLCFIHLAKFWSEVEKIRDINHSLKPLIIPDFLEKFDENVDKAYITAIVYSCKRQSIFIKTKDRSKFMNLSEKKERMLNAIRLWCLSEGLEEINKESRSDDLIFINEGHYWSFITEFDKTRQELLEAISKSKSNYIYIVTDDNAKRRELIKVIPEYCGIFCYFNPFGFGMLTQILREPQFLETR